ncbi:Histone H2B 1.1 (H2B1.1), partial [Durusdinium trenchii]
MSLKAISAAYRPPSVPSSCFFTFHFVSEHVPPSTTVKGFGSQAEQDGAAHDRGRRQAGEEEGETRDIPTLEMKESGGNKAKAQKTNWGYYVLKLLKQVHPTMKISKQAMAVMVSCVEDTFERISQEAGNLHRKDKGSTSLTTRDIQSAVRLVFPGELSRHAVSEGCK